MDKPTSTLTLARGAHGNGNSSADNQDAKGEAKPQRKEPPGQTNKPADKKKPASASTRTSSLALDKEVGKQALQSVSVISSNVGRTDAAQIGADKDTSSKTIEALREGLKVASTSEERRWYAERILETDQRQKTASNNAAERSTQTQRGFMKVALGLTLATISLGAIKLLQK
ncbi:hypothetical protein KEM63_07610 [Halopseudomonas nanhaiensis]|uniref:hypothetical protein n=1 Tax=Halopseudomonas nanhaiensis TaxID=2830842 RepID=UPI001CBDCB3E|nr:hypothetical protein [Halopseudomonas nanhaiensis]UAW99818.1 hypothetical protein KEM63_07610 [Halopseudomonas nanhaiensis]